MSTTPLAVVIVNYRTPDLALDCLASVAAERARLPHLTAVMVDGGSDDGSAERLASGMAAERYRGWTTLLPLAINGGFGYANNQAILLLAERGEVPPYLALINPDARLRPGALQTLATFLDAHPAAAAAGARLEHEDGSPQGAAFPFPTIRTEFARGAQTGPISRLLRFRNIVAAEAPVRVDWVTGAAVLLRTAALGEVGLFDDGFFLYFEETELMMRLRRAGWETWHVPEARVVHLGGQATQLRDPATGAMKRRRLPRYWYASRRRYFARTSGPAAAFAAGTAWLLGNLIWKLRCWATRRDNTNPLHEARDMLTSGLIPHRADDLARPPTSLRSRRAATPAWMSRSEDEV